MQIIRRERRPPQIPTALEELLPLPLCEELRKCGAPAVEELRLYADRICTVTAEGKRYPLGFSFSREELGGLLKEMCRGSLYAYSRTICQGYLTMEGGIRVGVCGHAATEKGSVIGVSEITALILRIPHEIPLSVDELLLRLRTPDGRLHGLLLYAPPGVGKTTALRALARQISAPPYRVRTVVVDTREELAHTLKGRELELSVLLGYPRRLGIEIAFRTLGADLILCDEIGGSEDASAILAAAGCGVPLVATLHADSVEEALSRPAIARLHRAGVFSFYVGLERTASLPLRYTFTARQEADRLFRSGRNGT